MSNWVNGKIIRVTHWSETLFSLVVDAAIAPYKAGQFVKLGLKRGDEIIARAYSFINAPDAEELEFYLAEVNDGELTPHLKQLKAGDEILVSKQASGYFVLEEIPDCQTLWMLATGTGVSPFLSILQAGHDLARFDNIVLVHAVRYQHELVYQPLMDALVQRMRGKLRLKTVVSRDENAQSLTGRIPALIESGVLEKALGLELSAASSHVMLCGNPNMIADCRVVLAQRDMHKHLRRKPGHISSEHYW